MSGTHLYRMFDKHGQLLYVGISKSAMRRLGEHLAEKSWASDIFEVRVSRYPTRQQAVAAERQAIQQERPLHNIAHRCQGPLAWDNGRPCDTYMRLTRPMVLAQPTTTCEGMPK